MNCGERMEFPNTFDEFAKDYGFKDKEEIYTNGSELIPIFRVKQWLAHIDQEPKTVIALERYRDLQDYFEDADIAKTILENQKEFKDWLKRLRRNIKKVDELERKLEALEKNYTNREDVLNAIIKDLCIRDENRLLQNEKEQKNGQNYN